MNINFSGRISERISYLMERLNLSQNQFSKEIGTSSAMISQIVTGGKDSFRVDLIQKIITRYPDLNPRWLLLGQGDIWQKQVDPSYLDLDQRIDKIEDDLLFIHAKIKNIRDLLSDTFNVVFDKKVMEDEDKLVFNSASINLESATREEKIEHLKKIENHFNKLYQTFWKLFYQLLMSNRSN